MVTVSESDSDNLRVQQKNSHDIRFRGFVELEITLGGYQSLQSLNVPFLVTTIKILGLNAIKMLVLLSDNLNMLFEMVRVQGIKLV